MGSGAAVTLAAGEGGGTRRVLDRWPCTGGAPVERAPAGMAAKDRLLPSLELRRVAPLAHSDDCYSALPKGIAVVGRTYEPGIRIVTVGGSSMSPLLDVGDQVEVVLGAAFRVGDVALIERGAEQEPVVHRVWLIVPGGRRSLIVHRGDHDQGRFALAWKRRVIGVVARTVASAHARESLYRELTAIERLQAGFYLARRLPLLGISRVAGLGGSRRRERP